MSEASLQTNGPTSAPYALGIDIGGSSVKVSLCVIRSENKERMNLWFDAQSDSYRDPRREDLCSAIQNAIELVIQQVKLEEDPLFAIQQFSSVGLCLPGRVNIDGSGIEQSLNLPCLNGWGFEDLLQSAIPDIDRTIQPRILSDSLAAGFGWVHQQHPIGRTAMIAIGTGIGLSVFDDGSPVQFGNKGVGHLGAVDLGQLDDHVLIDQYGAHNTAELFLGARALIERSGMTNSSDLVEWVKTQGQDDITIQALVKLLRLVHAIYTPDQIVLLGGIGLAFQSHHETLRAQINRGLTSLAATDWQLHFGDSLFQASRGVAVESL